MYVRISLLTGASGIDEGIDFLRDQVVPQLQQQKGFRGLTASGDRAACRINVLTTWETEADLDASESMAEKARADAAKLTGGQATVERYEQLAWEIGAIPPAPGAKLHIRRIRMDPGRVDENLEYFRRDVLPDIRSAPGFASLRVLMDRRTGAGSTGTMWVDDQSRKDSLARAAQRRPMAESRGVEFGEEQFADLFYAT